MTDVPEPEPRVRVFKEIAASTKQFGQILRGLARLRAEPIAGLGRLEPAQNALPGAVATVAALIPEPAGDEPAPRRRLSDTHMLASLRIEPGKLSQLKTNAARRHGRALPPRAWHSLRAHARGRCNSDSPAAAHCAALRPTPLPARTANAAVAAAADAMERVRHPP